MRKILLSLVVILILSLALSAVALSADDTSDVTLALKSGEEFIAAVAKRTNPEWENASLLNVKAYHDLQGNIISYMFTISKNSIPLGFMMVGNSQYNYSVLEASGGMRPVVPSYKEVNSTMTGDLDIQVEEFDNPMLVYLGYGRYYAIYEIADGQQIGIDLVSGTGVKYDELKSSLATSEQYKNYYVDRNNNLARDLDLQLRLDYNSLSVVLRDMDDDAIDDEYQNNNNCGPTSGAMISDWWQQWCPNLPDWTDDHDELYVEMYTNNWGLFGLFPGTSPTHFGPGFVEYADNHGYSNFTTDWCLNRAFSKIQDEIDAGRPLGVMFSFDEDYTNWHWCAVKGYYDTATDWIIINDPQYFVSFVDWGAVKLTSVITRIWQTD